MTRHRAYLLLGSNIRPQENLPAAVELLSQMGEVVAVSHVVESAAIGAIDQPNYCNLAVLLLTDLSAESLLSPGAGLRTIESRLGRVRDPGDRFAARTIDIDLCMFDDNPIAVGGKSLPDPDVMRRACAAVPLSELPGVDSMQAWAEPLSAIAGRLQKLQPLQIRPDLDARISNVVARAPAAETESSRRT